MTACQPAFQKDDGTAGELTATQKLRRQVHTIAEGAGLTEIITYALTTPEKAVEFTAQPSNLTELMWPNDSGPFCPPSKYDFWYP